ncbi:MAG: hypothetical protein ACYS18_08660 [Planctomycetota bacterium]|jgi:hypothetical protein
MFYKKHRKGTTLLLAMIVLALLSTWAVSIFSISGANLQIADNENKANCARASAESGLDITRFWTDRVCMPGTTPPDERFYEMADFLQTDLAAVSNITFSQADPDAPIYIGSPQNPVMLDSSNGQTFWARIQKTANVDILQMDIVGYDGDIDRTLRVNYSFGTRAHTVFDFGIASKGPLTLSGNIELGGVNVEIDASVYIESENDDDALSIIGNSQIAGDVSITNPDAIVTLQGGQAGIGGETGQDAIDNHVFTGVPPTEFPVPNPGYFEPYVQNVFDPNSTELENIRIPAGTNPTISNNTTIKGVVFIETPNIVTFSGNVDITGIVVGDGQLDDNSQTNQIIFLGTVSTHPVEDLPEEPQFTGLRDETGTFLMAPGFGASFGGTFDILNGAIAANGITFFGDAGGIIDGSILNYSDTPMTLSGNSDLLFNRSGTSEMPAGFGPEIILHYVASSYEEIVP